MMTDPARGWYLFIADFTGFAEGGRRLIDRTGKPRRPVPVRHWFATRAEAERERERALLTAGHPDLVVSIQPVPPPRPRQPRMPGTRRHRDRRLTP